jgi:hypothetical protein
MKLLEKYWILIFSIIISSVILFLGIKSYKQKEPIPQIDKTFEFCMKLIEGKDRYRTTEILAGCFEIFSGKKIELGK